MSGIYVPKTQNDFFSILTEKYKAIDSNWNLDASTPDGQLIAIISELLAVMDAKIKTVDDSNNINDASNEALNELFYLVSGKKRALGTSSVVEIEATGIPGSLIPLGSVVENEVNREKWVTLEDAVIESNSKVSIQAQSVNVGLIEASIASITKINTPTLGWQEVTNNAVATLGTLEETDTSLRRKTLIGAKVKGQTQKDNILAQVLLVDEVKHAEIYENYTSIIDPITSLPPHSIALIVDGGVELDVGEAIAFQKSEGIQTHALNTAVNVTVPSKISTNTTFITFSSNTFSNVILYCL